MASGTRGKETTFIGLIFFKHGNIPLDMTVHVDDIDNEK